MLLQALHEAVVAIVHYFSLSIGSLLIVATISQGAVCVCVLQCDGYVCVFHFENYLYWLYYTNIHISILTSPHSTVELYECVPTA